MSPDGIFLPLSLSLSLCLSLPYFRTLALSLCVCVCQCMCLSVLIKKNNAPTTIPFPWETKPSNFVRNLTQIMPFTDMMHLFVPIFTVREFIFVLSLSHTFFFSLFPSSFVSFAIWCVNVAHKLNHSSLFSPLVSLSEFSSKIITMWCAPCVCVCVLRGKMSESIIKPNYGLNNRNCGLQM